MPGIDVSLAKRAASKEQQDVWPASAMMDTKQKECETKQKHIHYLHSLGMCVLGDEGIFLHKDPKACDPEGVHGQQYSRWEKPEAELWKPHRQQLDTGSKSVYLFKEIITLLLGCTDGVATLS